MRAITFRSILIRNQLRAPLSHRLLVVKMNGEKIEKLLKEIKEGEGKDLKITCPICGKGTLKVLSHVHSIPYFGKVQEISVFCPSCGFKHSDVICLEEKEPMGYEVEVEGEEDLKIRIVRSSSGTVEIPELGVKIEPGPASMGFISNVEGILERVSEAIHVALSGGDEKVKEKGKELLEKINEIKEGKRSVRIILKDPTGNSAIVSEKAKKWKLSEEEVKKLKRGYFTVEVKRS